MTAPSTGLAVWLQPGLSSGEDHMVILGRQAQLHQSPDDVPKQITMPWMGQKEDRILG